jgi:excisionase family DNA binding protein
LGIAVLIAGLNIGGNIKKLNASISDKQFASSYSAPNNLELSVGDKKYLTETEAAVYLNITVQRVLELISDGTISEYIRTDEGYSISVRVLDEWFENEAYQTKLRIRGIAEDD